MHNPFLYILVSSSCFLCAFLHIVVCAVFLAAVHEFLHFPFSSFFQSTNCFLFDPPHRQFAIIDNPSISLYGPTTTMTKKKPRDRLQSHK